MRLFTGKVIYIKLHDHYIWTFFFFFFYSKYFTSNLHLYVKIGHSVLPISSILQAKIRIT